MKVDDILIRHANAETDHKECKKELCESLLKHFIKLTKSSDGFYWVNTYQTERIAKDFFGQEEEE